MSVRLYTQEEIVNHLQNASLSKYMYSFGKATRFKTIDRTGKSDSLYILPSTKMTRNTSIGYGTKYDFFKENHKITEFISIKRSYDKNFSPGYKYSFGLGREKFTKKVIPGFKIIDNDIPGPAKYNVMKTIGAESPKYTFRKLCGKTFWVNKYMNNPSSAEYNLPAYINKKGKFINSKIPDIKGAAFSKDKTNRWTYYKGNNVPGPDAYSLNKALMGNLYNSKYRSGPYIEMHRKLMNEKKIKNDTPGPGSYLAFSEFGVWVPKSMSRSIKASRRIKTENCNSDNKINEYFKNLMKRARTANYLRNNQRE